MLALVRRDEIDVIHDDEFVEEGLQGQHLIPTGFQQEGCRRCFGLAVDDAVALDAALGVQEEVVIALTRVECLDGVGDHAVEPTCRVGAGNEKKSRINRGEGGGGEQGVELAGQLGGVRGHRWLIVAGGCGMQGVCELSSSR